ncbi:MAG: hypothetical protein HFH58_14910 [Lachnospiraceae bacterium]|nr:hypothetical protein [Lachnospiraceae bacterium]
MSYENCNNANFNQPPSNQQILYALSQMGAELSHGNQLILATFDEIVQKNQRAMQNKRRVRTSEQLLIAPGHYPQIQYTFDNGARECLDLTHDVTGENLVFNLAFGNRRVSSHFGIFFKAENVMVLGDKRKIRATYLYDRFIRTGIRFNPRIPISIIKKLLFEFWSPRIDMAESTIEIPALAGWFNDQFWHKGNFPYKSTTDFPELPIFEKVLKSQKMDRIYTEGYFEEISEIQRWQDRFVIASWPFCGLLSSLFRAENVELYSLNFVLLQEFAATKICYWMQIYHRESLAPFSLDVTSKELQRILQNAQDEVLIFDASTDGTETTYAKKKMEQNIQKIINCDKKNVTCETIPANAKVFVSSNVIFQTKLLNIFVDAEFFENFSDQFQMISTNFEAIFYVFIEFIENNIEKILSIIRKRRTDVPNSIKFLAIILEILCEFWKTEGVDFQMEMNFPLNWTFEELSEYFSLGESSELVAAFVEAVRSEIQKYPMEEKCYGGAYYENTVFYDETSIYFPTDIFDNILHNCGMESQKNNLMLELQKKGKIQREGKSLAKTPQIGGIRFEAYVLQKSLFEIPGRPELISLSKER